MATNKEIMEQVLEDMPKEYTEKLEGKEGIDLYNTMETYPSIKNSFITTLTNKVTKTLLYSKIYSNQLKELKKGTLAYGDSIEELFVQMAQVKGFTANWDGGATEEADLIRKLVPKVSALYITSKVDYKSKATVMEKAMKKAFMNENGLSGIVQQIVGSIQSAMEFTEFKLTKETIKGLVAEGKSVRFNGNDTTINFESINTGTSNAPIKQTPYVVDVKTGGALDGKKLSKELRETVGLMKFPSKQFNLATELTWSNPQDMVLITTPSVIAEMDVNVLASAFNVSQAELVTRTILVDEMPAGVFGKQGTAHVNKTPYTIANSDNITKIDTVKPLAILMDKDLVQIWDEDQGTGTFYNAQGRYTNYFGNREGIFATCLFANMAVFY